MDNGNEINESFSALKKAAQNRQKIPAKRLLIMGGIYLAVFAVIYGIFSIYVVKTPDVPATASVFLSELAMLVILFTASFMYTIFSCPSFVYNPKELSAALTAALMGITACLFFSQLSYYCMPAAFTAFCMATMARRRDAFFYNIWTNILVMLTLLITSKGLRYSDTAVVFTVGVLCGTLAAYILRSDTRRYVYLIKDIAISALGFLTYFIFCYIVSGNLDIFLNNYYYMLISLFGQFILSWLLQPILELIFNLLTDTRLSELTDRNSKLLEYLMEKAPGTYNHSLAVANFAEICAIAIGENPYFARAAAYYHDVGKTANPEFFAENQSGENPHADMLPEVSAEIIRRHTTDGYDLCKKYKVPEEIAKITIEHHGTLPIAVFYNKAKSLTDSEVDIDDYSYHGDKPTSKIAAIIMICDAGEAAIRAMDKPDGERVYALMDGLIADRIRKGQFDDCPITMQDLNIVRDAIVGAYGGLFHKRIKYPQGK